METSTLARPASRQRAKRTTRGRRTAVPAVDQAPSLELGGDGSDLASAAPLAGPTPLRVGVLDDDSGFLLVLAKRDRKSTRLNSSHVS